MTARVLSFLSALIDPPGHAGVDRERLSTILIMPVGFALAALMVSLLIMFQFRSLGIFFLDDTLFNSDPKSMLEVLSHGTRSKSILYPELRNSIHPYLWFYFGPLVRLVAKLAVAIGLSDLSEVQLRALLGTFIVPLISSAQVCCLGILLYMLGLRPRHVALVLVLNIVAFSNLIFGSIPEHFAITNLSITIMLVIAVSSLRSPRFNRTAVWIVLGLFSAGITITNVVALGIVHAVTAWQARIAPMGKILLKSALLAVSIGLFVLASAHGLGIAIDGPLQKGSVRDNFVPRYFRADATTWHAPARAASALGNTIAPDWSDVRAVAPTPVPSPFDPELRAPFDEPPYPTYTLEPATGQLPGIGLIGLIALLGMVAGAALLVAGNPASKLVAVISVALVAYNLILHMLWGDEFFIYSQHWITPCVVLLSGLLTVSRRYRWASETAFAVFLIALVWNNETVIARLLTAARTAAGA